MVVDSQGFFFILAKKSILKGYCPKLNFGPARHNKVMAQLAAAIMLLALAWLNEHTGGVVDSIFHVCAAPYLGDPK